MLWLVALVLLLQSLWWWVFKPLIHVSTTMLSFSSLPWVLLGAGLWALAGRQE
ncbi:MAG: hypothetical protein VKK03_06735 [Synechococcus sp.]|nr:hypothetical protein [Synechococcus sp.]